jgi:hypothetical protein
MRRPAPWRLLAVAAVLVSLSCAFTLLMPRRCSVTEATLGRVKKGMTKAEAEAILGGPPEDYRTRPMEPYFGTYGDRPWEFWRGDEGDAWVYFEGGVVGGTHFAKLDPVPITTWNLFWWRVERWKSRWSR